MANFDELLDLVVESASDDFKKFNTITSDVNNIKKSLKNNIKNNEFDAAKADIDKLNGVVADLREFVSNINAADYDSKGTRIVRKALAIVEIIVGTCISIDAITSGDASAKSYIQSFGGGVLAGTGEADFLNNMSSDECKKYLTKVINELEKEIGKAKKKLDKRMKKSESSVKESVNEAKLAIYESCHAGEITEEERDILLGMVE